MEKHLLCSSLVCCPFHLELGVCASLSQTPDRLVVGNWRAGTKTRAEATRPHPIPQHTEALLPRESHADG